MRRAAEGSRGLDGREIVVARVCGSGFESGAGVLGEGCGLEVVEDCV